VIARALIALPLCVGLGIAFSPTLELIASLVTCGALLGLAGIMVFAMPARFRGLLPRLFITMAGGAVTLTMIYAAAYAWGHLMGTAHADIETMIKVHGMGNALGFSLLAMVAFCLEEPAPRPAPRGVPFSRIRSGWFIGADFFDRQALIDGDAPAPRGLVDDMEAYRREGFDPAALDAEVRRFYEETARFRLFVRPNWGRGFGTLAGLYRRLTRRWQQINLPLDPIAEDEMESRLVAIRDDRDGRRGVRAWIRTYAKDQSVVYAAAYSVHHFRGIPYMNIAFPLLGGHMTSVLRMNVADDDPHGLSLTTLPIPDHGGDQGVYFVCGALRMRLPFNETIEVLPMACSSAPSPPDTRYSGSTVYARHQMWLWGMRFLTLDYWLHHEG
jgi:hypothetical protein